MFERFIKKEMSGKEEKVDYLEVDDPLPGQDWVCISFVSPNDDVESKEHFSVAKFLQAVCKDKDMDFQKVIQQYKDFKYKNEEQLQRDFDEQNNFKTSLRGVKVRGTYSTRDEAERRAKRLQGLDSDFHVFVGQVGYWLPWDPCADKIEDESFIDSQLNDMMEKYKENNVNKDIFYEEQKREKVKSAREEVIKKKKEQMEQKKLEELNECLEEPVEELEGEDKDQEGKEEPVEELTEEVGGGSTVDSEIKASLESVDPWMASKIKEEKGEKEEEEDKTPE
tara:strand:+ start:242 stop:1081 length:840 start_codon:yes stop_codon:yes gene_type:complete